jgi:hypothetical protein
MTQYIPGWHIADRGGFLIENERYAMVAAWEWGCACCDD